MLAGGRRRSIDLRGCLGAEERAGARQRRRPSCGPRRRRRARRRRSRRRPTRSVPMRGERAAAAGWWQTRAREWFAIPIGRNVRRPGREPPPGDVQRVRTSRRGSVRQSRGNEQSRQRQALILSKRGPALLDHSSELIFRLAVYARQPPNEVISFCPSQRIGSPSTPRTSDPSASVTLPMHRPARFVQENRGQPFRRNGPDLHRDRRAAALHPNHRRMTIVDRPQAIRRLRLSASRTNVALAARSIRIELEPPHQRAVDGEETSRRRS